MMPPPTITTRARDGTTGDDTAAKPTANPGGPRSQTDGTRPGLAATLARASCSSRHAWCAAPIRPCPDAVCSTDVVHVAPLSSASELATAIAKGELTSREL